MRTEGDFPRPRPSTTTLEGKSRNKKKEEVARNIGSLLHIHTEIRGYKHFSRASQPQPREMHQNPLIVRANRTEDLRIEQMYRNKKVDNVNTVDKP